jgi:hypothetical protein
MPAKMGFCPTGPTLTQDRPVVVAIVRPYADASTV